MIRSCTSGRPLDSEHKSKPCGKTLLISSDPKTGREVLLCPICDDGEDGEDGAFMRAAKRAFA